MDITRPKKCRNCRVLTDSTIPEKLCSLCAARLRAIRQMRSKEGKKNKEQKDKPNNKEQNDAPKNKEELLVYLRDNYKKDFDTVQTNAYNL